MRLNRSQQRDVARLVGLGCIGAMLIALVRSNLFMVEEEVQAKHDVYFLPPPEQLVTISLGYRHAIADLVWAHMLVGQGLRLQERRRFDTLLRLYDAVNALDPTFRTPYVMADALISFNVIPTTKDTQEIASQQVLPYEDVLKAREVMERGVKALPDDAEMWLALGQFVSYIAPNSYLEDRPEEAARWRHEGVAYLERAVALSGGNPAISWQALGGASILKEAGELDAVVRFLERAYAVTEDEELRQDLERRLEVLRKRRSVELTKLDSTLQKRLEERLARSSAYQRRRRAAESLVKAELPFISATTGDVMGPPLFPSGCAGPGHHEPGCATSWAAWARAFEAAATPGAEDQELPTPP